MTKFRCRNFIIPVLIIFLNSYVNAEFNDNLTDGINYDDVSEAKLRLDSITDDVFTVMKKAFGLSEGKRSRRSPAILNNGFSTPETGAYRLTSVEPLFPLCEHPLYVDTTQLGDDVYAVCISATSKVTLGLLRANKWQFLDSWSVKSASKAVIFAFNKLIYILCVESEREYGTELLRYDPATETLVIDHNVNSEYPTTISLWTMKADGDNFHLAITNSEGVDNGYLGDRTSIFEWKGTYFDEYDSIRTYDAKDIQAFHIRGNAFLAVANHRVGVDNYNVDSEIFKFDINTWSWKSFQKFNTYGAVDFQYFELGGGNGAQESFLAVANQFQQLAGVRKYNINSVIYKYIEDRFVPFQCLPTYGATSIATVTGEQGQFLLVLTNYYEAVELYQYNGWNFVPSEVQYTRNAMGPKAMSASFHRIPSMGAEKTRLALVLANPVHEIADSVFGLSFAYENKLNEWYQQSLLWCSGAQHRFNSTMASELDNSMNNAYFIDQKEPIVVDGDLIFDDSLTVVGETKTPKIIYESTGYVLDHSVIYELDELNRQLEGLKERLERTKNQMADALRLSGDQIVTGEYDFQSASFSCESGSGCDMASVETTYLNDDNISNLYENVIYIDTNALFTGSLDVESMHVEGDIVVEGLVSGVNPSHLVTVNGHHQITAPKTIHHVISQDIKVDGLVNGLELGYENVLLTYGDQIVHGETTIEEIEVQTLIVDGNVNGLSLNEFYEDLVLIDEKPIITGVKKIQGPVMIDDLTLLPGATLNGIDLVDLWQNAMWKNEAQEIYAPMNFSSLHLVNPTVSTINGISPNSPDIVLVSKDVEINYPVDFYSPSTVIDEMIVTEAINSIGLIPTTDYPLQLDILLKSLNQVVYGQKQFPSIHLSDDSVVGGLVNGIDLAKLLSTAINRNGTQTLPGEWVFNHVEFRGPVELHGVMEGFEIQELLSRALRLDQPLPPDSQVVFKNLVHVDNLLAGLVNGIDVSNDLVVKTRDVNVYGVKTFAAMVLEQHSTLKGFINGINLRFLDDTLFDGRDQKSIAHVMITGDLVVQDLFVKGPINGIHLGSILTTLNDEEVSGPVHFIGDTVVHKDFHAKSLQITGLVNGVSLEDLIKDSMLYSAPQTVTGQKIFVNNLTIIQGSNLGIGNLNGFDLRAVSENTMLKYEPQVVTGTKTFVGMTHLDNLNFYGTIDGVSVWEMMSNWMMQDLPQTIVGDLIVDGDVLVNSDLNVNLVNGIHLSSFLDDLVKLDLANEITGHIKAGRVIFEGTVNPTGTIQGVDLSKDAVTRTGDRVIGGRKNFANQLNINGDLNVDGFLDGVKIEDLCSQTLTLNSDWHCKNLVVNGDVSVDGGISVGSYVNGLDLVDFDKSIWKVNEPVTVEGPVRFKQLTLDQPSTLNGLLNGMDLTDLSNNYFSLSRDQIIPSRQNFNGHVTIHNFLACDNLATADGLFNGLNLTSIASRLFKNLGDQHLIQDVEFLGDVHILGDLYLKNKVEGVSVPEDLMLKTRPNVVLGPLIYENDVVIINDLVVPEYITVQDVDISEWAKGSLLKEGHFSIKGVKTLDKLTVRDARSNRHIGGVNVTIDNILTVDDDQVIRHDVHFIQPVQAICPAVVRGKINGLDLNNLKDTVMYRDRPNVVTARTRFNKDVVVTNMMALGHVDNVNLSVIADEMTFPHGLVDLESSLLGRQSRLDRIGRTLESRPLMLLYYLKSQDLGSFDVISWASGTTSGGLKFLFISDSGRHENGCSNIYVYFYNDVARMYVQKSVIPSSFAGSVATFRLDGHLHLAVANIHPESKCVHLIGGLQIFRMNPETGIFESKAVLTSERVVHVEVVDFGTYVVLVAVTEMAVNLFFSGDYGRFEIGNSILLPNVKSVEHSVYNGIHYLTLMDNSNARVFYWKEDSYSFEPLQLVTRFKPNAILSINSLDEGTKISILAVSEGTTDHSSDSSWISIYDIVDDKILKKVQQITSSPVLAFDWIPYGNSFLLFVLGSDSNIIVYNWKGSGGFSMIDNLFVKGAKTLHAIPCSYNDHGCHYLAISGKICPESWWQEGQTFSMLLKSKINGN